MGLLASSLTLSEASQKKKNVCKQVASHNTDVIFLQRDGTTINMLHFQQWCTQEHSKCVRCYWVHVAKCAEIIEKLEYGDQKDEKIQQRLQELLHAIATPKPKSKPKPRPQNVPWPFTDSARSAAAAPGSPVSQGSSYTDIHAVELSLEDSVSEAPSNVNGVRQQDEKVEEKPEPQKKADPHTVCIQCDGCLPWICPTRFEHQNCATKDPYKCSFCQKPGKIIYKYKVLNQEPLMSDPQTEDFVRELVELYGEEALSNVGTTAKLDGLQKLLDTQPPMLMCSPMVEGDPEWMQKLRSLLKVMSFFGTYTSLLKHPQSLSKLETFVKKSEEYGMDTNFLNDFIAKVVDKKDNNKANIKRLFDALELMQEPPFNFPLFRRAHFHGIAIPPIFFGLKSRFSTDELKWKEVDRSKDDPNDLKSKSQKKEPDHGFVEFWRVFVRSKERAHSLLAYEWMNGIFGNDIIQKYIEKRFEEWVLRSSNIKEEAPTWNLLLKVLETPKGLQDTLGLMELWGFRKLAPPAHVDTPGNIMMIDDDQKRSRDSRSSSSGPTGSAKS